MEKSVVEAYQEIGARILGTTRDELYQSLRYLERALFAFSFVPDESVMTAGTDGLSIYYHPQDLAALFQTDPVRVDRLYLHMVLHGIFRHMTHREGREERLYALSCDIAVESILDDMNVRCIRCPQSLLRRETYRRLGEKMTTLTAPRIYQVLEAGDLSFADLDQMEREFRVDDHACWPKDSDADIQVMIENQWQDISEQTQMDLETFSREAGAGSGHLVDQLRVANREKVDLRSFLKKFTTLREEAMLDPDAFDYVFYMYGLSLYGNMPLIEAQEVREVQKIEDFVLVIDTSMSCSGALVEKFLTVAYEVLAESNGFYRKLNIHIIQCDEQVHSDVRITSQEELKDYMEQWTLYGEGGTDFRPAFAYVDELIRRQELTHLKGLLYFTDGRGIYPEKRPDYQVAFVFMEEDYEDVRVPPWAMKLIIGEEDLCT